MNAWAIVLYVLEVFTLLGVPVGLSLSKKGEPFEISNVEGVFGLAASALGLLAIYNLTLQSSANHAVALGITYAVITLISLPNFIREWVRGSAMYTSRRALLVTLGTIVDIVLISILAFAS